MKQHLSLPVATCWGVCAIILCLASSLSTLWSAPVACYYTFGKEQGGVAGIEVDEATGAISKHLALGSSELSLPKKLAVAEDGRQVIVTSDEGTKAWIYGTAPEPQLQSEVELGGKTEDVAVRGYQAFLVASKGFFYSINLRTGKIEKTWNSREGLTPPGRKGEDILMIPGKEQALVTFQKDSEKGKHLGSRVLQFDLASFKPLADLQLPRDHAGLHLGENLREQGPSPEMMFFAPKTNTLVISLDLYGALAFADLDAVLRGSWKRLQYMPCSLSGAWGTAFPDRGLMFEAADKEFLLVSNAAANGGMTLVDVGRRKVLQEFVSAAGAENPILLPAAKTAVTVVSGKIKARGEDGLESKTEPGRELLVFDLKSLDSYRPVTLDRIAFDKPVTRVEALNAASGQLLLLLVGEEGSQEWVVYDLATRTTKDRSAALGVVARIVVRR
ncbi:MAG TPA: hypothetical protein VK956_12475 [Verrucomicrobium sp.]|nr:hypothetical protein [Verrucomicrobium sp.]